MENNLTEGYYFINGTKKMLYHNNGVWYKPAFDTRKKLCGYYKTPITTKIKSWRFLTEIENKVFF